MRKRATAGAAIVLACTMASAWSCGGSGSAKRSTGTGGSGDASPPADTGGSSGRDASIGTGGRLGTGGAVSTVGGAGGMGGTATVSSGGATGGTIGTGGTTTTGGTTGTGGAPVDAGAPGCTCTQRTTSWDCYCSAYDCTTTLAYYQPADGGTGPWVIAYEEYADCKLGVVTTKTGPDSPLRHVFDLTSGRLVGEERGTDHPLQCPFGPDSGSYQKLAAGVLGPEPTCVRTKCTGNSTFVGTLCGDAGI